MSAYKNKNIFFKLIIEKLFGNQIKSAIIQSTLIAIYVSSYSINIQYSTEIAGPIKVALSHNIYEFCCSQSVQLSNFFFNEKI